MTYDGHLSKKERPLWPYIVGLLVIVGTSLSVAFAIWLIPAYRQSRDLERLATARQRVRDRPEEAKEVFDRLRNDWDAVDVKEISAGYYTEPSFAGESEAALREWLSFVCFLADKEEPQALQFLKSHKITAAGSKASIYQFLSTSKGFDCHWEQSWNMIKGRATMHFFPTGELRIELK